MGKFNKKTVRDVELKGKHVLLRADYNVPLKDGRVGDGYRLAQSLPTIRYILKQGPASLVIISHLGRPEGKVDEKFSLRPVAQKLEHLLGAQVHFATDCIGPEAKLHGAVTLFENLRFHPGEEKNDADFAKQIAEAAKAEVFVQDGFGVVHRAHASTSAITKFLPSVAGLLLEKECKTIEEVVSKPDRPLMAVVGGAKISDKIDVLSKFIDIADCVAVGGALANNFLHAEKLHLGKSLVEPEAFGEAQEILAKARKAEMERNFQFMLPVDGVVSHSMDGHAKTRVVDFGAHTLADIEAYPLKPNQKSHSVAAEEAIFDIGPITAGRIAGAVGLAGTIVWAGTLGVTETAGIAGSSAPFAHGTRTVVEAIIGSSNRHKNKAFSLVGGGDTVGYVESQRLVEDFSFVSTGGSASLDLMAGHPLPGVDALQSK